MMKRSVITVLLMLSGLGVVFSQSPFAQVHNTPMLISPSQAGSKQKIRIGIVNNRYRDNQNKYSSNYLSVDWLIKKLGSGVGLYYLHTTEGLNVKTSSTFTLGLSVAPKYNVHSKTVKDKIAFSFSPSFFIEYETGSRSSSDPIYEDRTIYSQDHPDGQKIQISEGTVQSDVTQVIWRYGAGLMLNSQRVTLLYKGAIEPEKTTEYLSPHKPSWSLDAPYQRLKSSYTLYQTSHIATVSVKFPKREESLMSFTPIAGIGFRAPLNAPSSVPVNTSNEIYSGHLRRTKASWNYRHLSMNFRISKFLTGVSYTYAENRVYRGVNLGFQNKFLRINSTYSKSIRKSAEKYHFWEVGVTIFI